MAAQVYATAFVIYNTLGIDTKFVPHTFVEVYIFL